MSVKSMLDLIGDTPLIKLKRASEETGCTILGKAEFLNPGQSVKDRAALGIIRDAEKTGALKPGGTIVEGTAGNTGIGLAMVGAALGYKTKIVIPRTQSEEKKIALRLHGAELIIIQRCSCLRRVARLQCSHHARRDEARHADGSGDDDAVCNKNKPGIYEVNMHLNMPRAALLIFLTFGGAAAFAQYPHHGDDPGGVSRR